MRPRTHLLLVVGLLGALAACGDGTATDSTVPSTTAAPTTMPSDDLTAMLLTASDLGPGWKAGPEVGEADFTDSYQIPCDDVAVNPTLAERLRPRAGVQFEASDGASRILIELVTTGPADEIAPALEAYIGAVESCPAEATWGGAPVSITPLAIGEVGDQRAAWILSASEGGGNGTPVAVWYVRTATVRVDGHVISLGLTEILDGPEAQPAISDTAFLEMVATAVAKFAA